MKPDLKWSLRLCERYKVRSRCLIGRSRTQWLSWHGITPLHRALFKCGQLTILHLRAFTSTQLRIPLLRSVSRILNKCSRATVMPSKSTPNAVSTKWRKHLVHVWTCSVCSCGKLRPIFLISRQRDSVVQLMVDRFVKARIREPGSFDRVEFLPIESNEEERDDI